MRTLVCFLAISCGLTLLGGCSGKGDLPKLAPADGTVTYQGKPVAGATVTFAPDKGPLAMAVTDLNGKFTLNTGTFPGVVVGPVKVGIIATPAAQGAGSDLSAISKRPQNDKEAAAYLEKANELQQKFAEGENPEALQPKSLIPEKYTKVDTSGLSFTINANGDNHFTIDLKD